MAKKRTKKTVSKNENMCGPGNSNSCDGLKSILALVIIVLIWLSSACEMWSKVVITISAAIILLSKFCPWHNQK